jgi:hypothetical protein
MITKDNARLRQPILRLSRSFSQFEHLLSEELSEKLNFQPEIIMNHLLKIYSDFSR